VVVVIVLDASFCGLVFFLFVQIKDEVVDGVFQFDELKMGLEAELGAALECCDLLKGKGLVSGRIEGLDESPFDSSDVYGKGGAAAGEMRIGDQPIGKLRAEIPQSERPVWVRV